MTKFVAVKAPPTEDELARMASEDFTTVVDLRREGEPNQLLRPSDEAEIALEHGLRYVHRPVDAQNLDERTVERIAGEIAHLPGRVLVHCASGRRAERVVSAAKRLATTA
jgi:uncharacterized protein (TIGR01244 family)